MATVTTTEETEAADEGSRTPSWKLQQNTQYNQGGAQQANQQAPFGQQWATANFNPRPPKGGKKWNNKNYCWSHGYDCNDTHTIQL